MGGNNATADNNFRAYGRDYNYLGRGMMKTEKILRCSLCDEEYTSMREVRDYGRPCCQNSSVVEVTTYHCQMCGKICYDEDEMILHERRCYVDTQADDELHRRKDEGE